MPTDPTHGYSSSYAAGTSAGASSATSPGPSIQPGSGATGSSSATSGRASSTPYDSSPENSQEYATPRATASDAAVYNEYAAAYARQVAEAALRLAEQQTVRVLTESSSRIAAIASVEPAARASAGEASQVVSETNRAPVSTPVPNAPLESSTIPAFHSSEAAPDGNAELLAKMDEEEMAGITRTAAVSAWELRGPDPEPGRLVTGSMGPDLDALDQDVSRFFTHLGTQALQALSWSNLSDIGSWLAGGMAVAGAVELARRSGRQGNRLAGVSADGQSPSFDFHSVSD